MRKQATNPHRVAPGAVDLGALATDGTPQFSGGKHAGREALADLGDELADLQERLFAQRTKAGSTLRVLLVLQGMDTSGKGGTLRHTIGMLDPQGVRITSFKAPTEEELAHHFLWRIKRALPEPGYVGVFDRSHYEDVLIAKVRELVGKDTIESRYGEINRFEEKQAEAGIVWVKCMLHVSPDEQRERLAARLDDPTKYWKYNPGDLDERALWPAYQDAYTAMLERTNTEIAPWYVIPADRKWYRNLAVGQLLLDTLRGLDLEWPEADFDVAAERARLKREGDVAST